MRILPERLLRMAAGLALMIPALGCTPARLLNTLISEDGYKIQRDVPYGEHPRNKLDIYVPESAIADANVAVFFYGGSWKFGSKADYLFVGQALASKGIITVIADYRLYPEVRFPAFVEDGAKAVGWVHRHIAGRGGDPNRIFLIGHSAGAHIASMLALNPDFLGAEGVDVSELKGLIGLAGAYDFLPIESPTIREVFAVEDLAATQPITHASDRAPPTLLLTGDNDDTVLPGNSARLGDAINRRGGQADVKIYKKLGHTGIVLSLASPFRWLATTLDDIASFISRERPQSRKAA